MPYFALLGLSKVTRSSRPGLDNEQNSATPALDFPWEFHGCPNPFVENQLYFLFEGTLREHRRPTEPHSDSRKTITADKVHCRVANFSNQTQHFADEAKGLITNTGLGRTRRSVGKLESQRPKAIEITGSARTRGLGARYFTRQKKMGAALSNRRRIPFRITLFANISKRKRKLCSSE